MFRRLVKVTIGLHLLVVVVAFLLHLLAWIEPTLVEPLAPSLFCLFSPPLVVITTLFKVYEFYKFRFRYTYKRELLTVIPGQWRGVWIGLVAYASLIVVLLFSRVVDSVVGLTIIVVVAYAYVGLYLQYVFPLIVEDDSNLRARAT